MGRFIPRWTVEPKGVAVGKKSKSKARQSEEDVDGAEESAKKEGKKSK